MKSVPHSRQHHDLYAKYRDQDSEIRGLLGKCGLNTIVEINAYLMGANPTLADIAIFPFVRPFAHIDRAWFDCKPWPYVARWLDHDLDSAEFATSMQKSPVWEIGAPEILFWGRGQ